MALGPAVGLQNEVVRCKKAFDWAVLNAGVVDADILSLTTVAGLAAMILAKTTGNPHERRKAVNAIKLAGTLGFINNTQVAAANTVNGIRDVFDGLVSSLNATGGEPGGNFFHHPVEQPG